jgi:hypothetical protein
MVGWTLTVEIVGDLSDPQLVALASALESNAAAVSTGNGTGLTMSVVAPVVLEAIEQGCKLIKGAWPAQGSVYFESVECCSDELHDRRHP